MGSGVQRREQNNTIVHDDDNISHFAFRISHFAFRISHFARARSSRQNIATSSHAKFRQIFASKYRHIFAHEVSPDLRARNITRSLRAKYRQIFARNIDRSSRERLRKPDTLFDFAQIGHLLGFAWTLWLLPLRTLRHETLSESVSCRSVLGVGAKASARNPRKCPNSA